MKVYEDLNEWLAFRKELRAHDRSIGFVPTMGALHDGHLSLLKRAGAENEFSLTSIFVNPTQFNNPEDLDKYPRTLKQDLEKLAGLNVDAVLLPNEKQMYRDGYKFRVTESDKSKILCGKFRPGHFDGVLSVVLRLLGLAQARRCYMGEKDYQQYLLVKEMAESFFIDTEIVPCPTVREASGLAMSSRNARLSSQGREKAALIFEFLKRKSAPAEITQALIAEGFDVEYIEEHWGRRFAAVNIENVRLIDNVQI